MDTYIENYINTIDAKLEEYLVDKYPEILWQAMRYSVMAGGKRLRPMLVLESNKICGGTMAEALPTACAIEMLHTYSLIHDDLPCMDNDDYRRGKLTNHKVFGEGMAVLAGDGLLSLAPQIILTKTPKTVSRDTIVRVLEEFFDAIGQNGMLGGQVVDIISANKNIDIDTFEYIHNHKTGKLFEFSLRAGAILANANNDILNALTEYAKIFGFAFQIADDILDEISTLEKLGKTPHKDANAHKNTYTSLYGLEKSKNKLLEFCNNAKNILQLNNIKSELLIYIVDGLTEKVKGD